MREIGSAAETTTAIETTIEYYTTMVIIKNDNNDDIVSKIVFGSDPLRDRTWRCRSSSQTNR